MSEAIEMEKIGSYRQIDRCLVCDGTNLRDVLDLGAMPLANAFHDGSKLQAAYPLLYRVCQSCWHGQLSCAVDPHLMFDNYLYVSGTTRTLRSYFQDFVRKVERDLGEGPLRVLEIGCNDGSLLKEFQERGHHCMGVDPAQNLPQYYDAPVVVDVWSEEAVEHVKHFGPIDAIIAMNVLAHVADPLTFLKLCKRVLAPGGRIYVQTSQCNMLLHGEWDTLYHEHVSYFTASSFLELAKRAELGVARISRVPIHGTSYLVELTAHVQMPSNASHDVAKDEAKMGYYAPAIYDRFSELAMFKRSWASLTITSMRPNGYVVVGYGAAAKGMTFLNYTGIELDAVVDDNPLKVGKLCAGSNIPVVGPEWMAGAGEKVCWLLLSWNFAEEIIERIRNARPDAKDLFVTCFPRGTIQ